MFRSLFSIFILVILLIGIFSIPEASFGSKDLKTSLYSLADSNNSHQADGSNCDDEGQACHKCHLGHCAFPVRFFSVGYLDVQEKLVVDNYRRSLPSAILNSLYRPPIS